MFLEISFAIQFSVGPGAACQGALGACTMRAIAAAAAVGPGGARGWRGGRGEGGGDRLGWGNTQILDKAPTY